MSLLDRVGTAVAQYIVGGLHEAKDLMACVTFQVLVNSSDRDKLSCAGALLTCEGFLDAQFRWPRLASDCPRTGEETAVDGVNDRGSVNHAPTKVTAV